MPVTYIHGNKSFSVICLFVLIVITFLCTNKVDEIKIELKKNIKEYEIVSTKLKETNRNIVKRAGL